MQLDLMIDLSGQRYKFRTQWYTHRSLNRSRSLWPIHDHLKLILPLSPAENHCSKKGYQGGLICKGQDESFARS
jgi:hypothetical protein